LVGDSVALAAHSANASPRASPFWKMRPPQIVVVLVLLLETPETSEDEDEDDDDLQAMLIG
jgi:hypothetical protein